MSWSVVAEVIGIVGQPTIVRLMPGLRPSRTGVLAFLFLVGGRRLRRSPRRFVRSLKLDHQLNQLVLAQALQISAIHAHMDSEIGLPGKGARKSGASSRSARRKWRWVITVIVAGLDDVDQLAFQRPCAVPVLAGGDHFDLKLRTILGDEALEQLVRVFQFLLKLVASGIGVLAEQGEGAFVLAGGVQLEVDVVF